MVRGQTHVAALRLLAVCADSQLSLCYLFRAVCATPAPLSIDCLYSRQQFPLDGFDWSCVVLQLATFLLHFFHDVDERVVLRQAFWKLGYRAARLALGTIDDRALSV